MRLPFETTDDYRTAQAYSVRARLHQGVKESTQSYCCDDARDIGLIENNGNKKSCSRMGLQPLLE